MKKLVFLVLTLLLLTGLCLGIGFSAMAAETDGVNALAQTIMAGYAPAEVPADAKPVRSYSDFVAMDPAGVYYLDADFKVTSSYLLTFEGELYGNGHTLTLSGAPMFTKLDGATVCDITFEGTVTNKAATVLSYVGALTREAYNATIVGITNKAPIVQEVKEMFAGGISGHAENTTFKYCVNYGDISGNTEALRPGGIMGECNNASAWVVLENCINYGTINGVNQTGGLVSRIENGKSLRMTDCANFGTVNVAGSDSGGVIGKVTQTTTEVTMERCYNSGTVNAGSIAGGVMGYVRASKLTLNECYNGCFVDGCDCEGTVHGYVTQKKSADIGGIVAVLECSGVTEITITNCTNYGKVYSLIGNRIGGIAGCMEGKTLTISNCHNYGSLTSDNYGAGLFGRAGASAGVLTLENCSNNGNVTVGANGKGAYVGGLIGYQQYSLGIRFVNCTNNGDLSSTWNAGGLLCRMDGGMATMTDGIEFINCVNNGDIVKCSGTAGGILGIMEQSKNEEGYIDASSLAKVSKLIFTNCQNNGDITFTNYAGGMTGIAWAVSTTMSNCTNTGNMIYNNVANINEYGEIGGLAGRLFGSLSATDCINTGNIYDPSTSAPSSHTQTFVLGGIAGRVGIDYEQTVKGVTKKFEEAKNDFTTLVRCINTGIIGNSKAVADAATTYAISSGGIIGDANGKLIANQCVNAGDVYGNYNVGGISVWAGQSNVGGSTYDGCVVLGDVYCSGTKVKDLWGGPAGISNYVWGNANVYRCTILGDITLASTNGAKDTPEGRGILTALIGYTNNEGGKFQYNYFTGKLIAGEGVFANTSFIGNTRSKDVASDEGGDIIHNYSKHEYHLHYNSTKTWSDTKTTSITPEAMKALASNNLTLVKLCDGTVLPISAQTVRAFTTALNAMGHTYGNYAATADPNNHSASCACGDVIYEAHRYDNACDVDCNDCGYVRFEQPPHEGEFACSETCKHCGAAITPDAAHAGEFACSTVCATCGAAVTGTAHTVSSDCDVNCDVCGEDVVPVSDQHVLIKPCDGICSVCHAIVEDSVHVGKYSCSTVCQWCDATVEASAEHEGEYACSKSCRYCDAEISGEEHTGLADCATACQWCGIVLETEVAHTYDNACDTECNACGELREVAEHVGAFACSALCKHCGALISPEVEHTAEHACSETCELCGEPITNSAAHDYDNACDTDCNACGAVRATQHVYDEEPCDADCNVCGFTRDVAHKGEYLCSDTCHWCGIDIVPASRHTGLFACSELCKWCAGQVADEDRIDHTYDHNCDTICNVCEAERPFNGHRGVYPCDDVCQWCEAPITPGAHVYDNSCDSSCNNCGAINITRNHKFDNACDPDCNKTDCDYVRDVAHSYDNDCDKDCNNCGELRETQHVYDNACDNTCNACGNVDVLREHTYDNSCDADCNACGATREASHTFEGACSGFCTKCEQQIREDAHEVDTWETVTAPTVEAEGLEKGECTFCGEEVTRTVAKLDDSNTGVQDDDADTKILGMSTDLFILVVAAAALVIFNIVVISIASAKKKKADKNKDETTEEAEAAEETATTEEAAEEAEATEEKADKE